MTELAVIFDELDLAQYLDSFLEQGFDTWDSILDITEPDSNVLRFKLGHRRKLERKIAATRGIRHAQALASLKQSSSGVDDKLLEDGKAVTTSRFDDKDGSSTMQSSKKRKYERQIKSDENAPARPHSAYVIFSNKIREDLKGKSISFTEIAKLVGKKWQYLTPSEKETYKQKAFAAKEKFMMELVEYRKTKSYKTYSEYLRDFRAKHLHTQENSQCIIHLQKPYPRSSSPEEEFSEFTLPSISNLLGIADNKPSQQQEQGRQRSLPLTPPTHLHSGSESRQSPSSFVSSTTQDGSVSTSAAYYFAAGTAINNLGVNLERQSISSTELVRTSVYLSQPQHPQHGLPTSYTMTPTTPTMNNYDRALAGNPQRSNRTCYEWPRLNYNPASTNPWQHHHRIAPSSSCFSLPQAQYICPTCSKTFTRPSSLRIHSRGHTGERPFRCPIRGCGKKFSVRSNMKRHERVCRGAGGL